MKSRRTKGWCRGTRLILATAGFMGAINVGLKQARAGVDQWIGPSGGAWDKASNWSNGLPQSTSDVVDAHTGGKINFNTTTTINSIVTSEGLLLSGGLLSGAQSNAASTLAFNGTLGFDGGFLKNFTLQSQSIGNVVVYSGKTNLFSNLVVNAPVSCSGTFGTFIDLEGRNTFNGAVNLSVPGVEVFLHMPATSMNLGSGASLTGCGIIQSSSSPTTLVNDGVVTANVAANPLTLGAETITGRGVFEARNGAQLVLRGAVGGTSEATAPTFFIDSKPGSGIVFAHMGGLKGFVGTSAGTLNFDSGYTFIGSARVAAALSVTPGATVHVLGTNALLGTMQLASPLIGLGAAINAPLVVEGSSSLELTSGASIRGFGAVLGGFGGGIPSLINGGLISANVPGQILLLDNNMVGAGTWEARNGGILQLKGTFNGSNPTFRADANSQILTSATFSGSYGTAQATLAFTGGSLEHATFAPDFNVLSQAIVVINQSTVVGTVTLSSSTSSTGSGLSVYGSVLAEGGSIGGFGTFNHVGTFTNNGRLTADMRGRSFTVYSAGGTMTGSGLFEARNGGMLNLTGIQLESAQGARFTTDADTASQILFISVRLAGFSFTQTGNAPSFGPSSLNVIDRMEINGDLNLPDSSILHVANTNTLSASLNLADHNNGDFNGDGIILDPGSTLTILPGGQIHGFSKTIDDAGSGAKLINLGLISANAPRQTLFLLNQYTTCSGTIRAENGGKLLLGGTLQGIGAHVDALGGTVLVDGGRITGSVAQSTGGGLTFSGNTNNAVSNLTSGGDLSFPEGSVATFFGANTVNASVFLNSASPVIRFGSAGASLTIGQAGRLLGFGGIIDPAAGAKLVNQGHLEANVAGKTLSIGAAWTSSGTVSVATGATLASAGAFTQVGPSSTTTIDGLFHVTGGATIVGGILNGDGTLDGGTLANLGGTLIPGHIARRLTLTGMADYHQGSTGTLVAELAGYEAGISYDQLAVSGDVQLDGVLAVRLGDGFRPMVGDTFDVVLFGTEHGDFTTITSDTPGIAYSETLMNDRLRLTVTAVPEPSVAIVTGLTAFTLGGSRLRRRRSRIRRQ